MSTPISMPPGTAGFAAAALFVYVWNWALYGVLTVQLYVYSYNFPEDGIPFKLLVYGVYLIETVQTVISGVDMYYRFATSFGSLEHLIDPYLSPFVWPIIEAIVSLTVQYFFAYRVWVLSNRRSFWLCLLICTSSTVDATAAFTGGINTHVQGKFGSGWVPKVLVYTWLGGNAVADILITMAMIYYLSIRKVGTMVPSSNHALSRIVRLTVETNILTTTTGVVSLLLLSIFPNKIWYTCPASMLGKLYSNTLLVSLNNRIAIRDGSSARGTLPTSESTSNRLLTGQSSLVHVKIESFRYPLGSGSESCNSEDREKVIGVRFPRASQEVN